MALPEAITREELYMKYLTGDTSIELPLPITRKEIYLYYLCQNGTGGGTVTPEQIEAAVNKYLTENPVQAGATKEQAEQIQENKENIELSKAEVDSLSGDIINLNEFMYNDEVSFVSKLGFEYRGITSDDLQYYESDTRYTSNKTKIPSRNIKIKKSQDDICAVYIINKDGSHTNVNIGTGISEYEMETDIEKKYIITIIPKNKDTVDVSSIDIIEVNKSFANQKVKELSEITLNLKERIEKADIGELRGNIYPMAENIRKGYMRKNRYGKVFFTENEAYTCFFIKVEKNKEYFFDNARFALMIDSDMETVMGNELSNITNLNSLESTYFAISYNTKTYSNYVISPTLYDNNSYNYMQELLSVDETGRLKDFLLYVKNQNVLFGKKYIAAGDSYSAWSDAEYIDGDYKDKEVTYQREILIRNSMQSDFSVNFAESGSTMALAKDSEPTKDTVDEKAFSNNKYLSIPVDTDYLTIAFGINDSSLCDLGQIGDTENTTFFGAWHKVITWMATNRPNTKIGIIIFQRNDNEYYQAVKTISEYYGIPYLDFYGGKDTPIYVDGKAYSVDETIKQLRHNYFCGHAHESEMEETFQGITVKTKIVEENPTHPGYRAHIDESKIIEAFLRRL